MGSYSLLFLVIPLLVFVLVDTFGSLKMALAAAVLAALAECGFSYYAIGELDSFSVFSVFLVLLLAVVTYYKNSRKIFYLKPAILSLGVGLFLLITYFMGQNVLYDGAIKYSGVLMQNNQQILNSEQFETVFKNCSLTLGIASILHAMLATFAALKLGRWGWFILAGLSSYAFIIGGVIAAFMI